MAKSSYIPVLSDHARSSALKQPPQPYPFKPGEIVSKPTKFEIPSWGAYLVIPPACAVVLHFPDGRDQVFLKGGMFYEETGVYNLLYVDLRRQSTPIYNIQADSTDAWRITMNVDITWEAHDPLQITRMNLPYQSMVSLCRDAVIHFIQTRQFDQLIPTPTSQALDENEVGFQILSRLKNHPALRAFNFISLNIRERHGDRRRTDIIQNAMVQQTENEQNMKVQLEQLKMELEMTRQQFNLVKERGIIMVENAHNEVLVDEEKQKFEFNKAKTELEVSKLLRPAYEQSIELQQLSAKQRLEHEQLIIAMELYSAAFRDLAYAIAQASLTPELQYFLESSQAFVKMQSVFTSLSRLVPQELGSIAMREPLRILPVIDVTDVSKKTKNDL